MDDDNVGTTLAIGSGLLLSLGLIIGWAVGRRTNRDQCKTSNDKE